MPTSPLRHELTLPQAARMFMAQFHALGGGDMHVWVQRQQQHPVLATLEAEHQRIPHEKNRTSVPKQEERTQNTQRAQKYFWHVIGTNVYIVGPACYACASGGLHPHGQNHLSGAGVIQQRKQRPICRSWQMMRDMELMGGHTKR